MNEFRENLQFLTQFFKNLREIGAVLPTSAAAGDALAAECARRPGPKRVLEVGAGTGAITTQIVKQLTPVDELALCEINPALTAILRQRIQRETLFQPLRNRIQFYETSILDLPTEPQFDFIISSLPFNNCPPDFVDAVLGHYQKLLRPGGVVSYIEYVGGSTLKQISGLDPAHNRRQQVYARYERFEFRRDLVVQNLPPAWIHYLRFVEPNTATALTLQPLQQSNRVAVGNFAVDSDALPFLLGCAVAAAGFYRSAPRSRLWLLPALSIPLLAAFFRDPMRPKVVDPRVAYAASDGVVLAVERLIDERFGNEEWLRIAIFLSLLDVHLNFAPVAGKVLEIVEEEGGFAAANQAAAEHNQALYTVIEGIDGRCIVAQRVGLIARRIVNRCKPGSLLAQGDKMGLIRFGSRTDVYLPAHKAQALVKAGDRVIGGVTSVARFV